MEPPEQPGVAMRSGVSTLARSDADAAPSRLPQWTEAASRDPAIERERRTRRQAFDYSKELDFESPVMRPSSPIRLDDELSCPNPQFKLNRGVTWTSNFSSLDGRGKKKMPRGKGGESSSLHLEISQWLGVLDLQQYGANFEKFEGVEDLLNLSEAEIKGLGVKNAAHRARIASSLVVLKKKYGEKRREEGESEYKRCQRHSVAVDGGKMDDGCQSGADSVFLTYCLQSKSLCDIKMESIPDSGPDEGHLRKALEWELSLDGRDLRSHAWYHGCIPRSRAEEILEKDGDFLVRDCTSQPGNYVLSTKCKGQSLHFVINKVVLQPDTVYERIQFQFEDEAYDTVSDLVTFYVGSGKAISALSGAKIQNPRNRYHPLSFYETKYNVRRHSHAVSPALSASGYSRCNAINTCGGGSPLHPKRETPPMLPGKQRSLSLVPADLNGKVQALHFGEEKSASADGVIRETKHPPEKFVTNSLPRETGTLFTSADERVVSRVTTDPSVSPRPNGRKTTGRDVDRAEAKRPPPKPSRTPSVVVGGGEDAAADRPFRRATSYQAFGSDSGNGSSDSAQSSAAGDSNEVSTPCGSTGVPRGVIIKNPRYGSETSAMVTSASSTTLKAVEYDPAAEESLVSHIPEWNVYSVFDLENFQTLLLPSVENKPVDQSALECVKNMLRENGSRILANHLTRIDMEITVNSNSKAENPNERDLGVSSGIELCALPLGQQLRSDILERVECLKLLVAVTILTCPTEAERAEILHKWIQVAIDIKTAVGNLFGFSEIMLGLSLPQVQRLTKTWHVLRQKFTDSAFNYEAKLRPTLKNMNECTNPQAPNTTIPHILPFVLLQDLALEDILGNGTRTESASALDCLSCFESAPDSGLSTLFAHLESGRKFAKMIPFYRRNAEIILGDSKIDDLILDMFRTEFHLKFLWGSRGATVNFCERRTKFAQVLTVMSEKCEPPEVPLT